MTTDKTKEFEIQRTQSIHALSESAEIREMSLHWLITTFPYKYTYNFTALGRPIIQFPPDIVAVQELIWDIKPDLIIETGIAHGGSLVLSASALALLDYCESVTSRCQLDPHRSRRKVVGVDIEIRRHNRSAIEAHPLSHLIHMIENSSVAPEAVAEVHEMASTHNRIMLLLDSNHGHEHVLSELEAYAPLITPGSYCIVFDTIVEYLPDEMMQNRPWSKGNNPKTAVGEYLRRLREEGRTALDGNPLNLEVDGMMDGKLLISAAPGGYLRRPQKDSAA